MRVLIVDAANVVGSRPDGWWRDRAGAAERLHEQLAAAGLPYDEVLLVLEGRARDGRSPGEDRNVLTVHASGSGDDTIVGAVTERLGPSADPTGDPGADADSPGSPSVVVVTADRGLRARVEAAGGATKGPSWLLDQL